MCDAGCLHCCKPGGRGREGIGVSHQAAVPSAAGTLGGPRIPAQSWAGTIAPANSRHVFACAMAVSVMLLPLAAAVVKQLWLWMQIKELRVYHGNLTKSAELDCLFMLPGAAVVVSAKRSQGAQHWQKSFIDHLDAMWREWKQVPVQVTRSFAAVPSLHLVAVSAGGGDISGMQPLRYGEGRPKFVAKKVKCSRILLHQLVARLPAWEFCQG